MTAPVNVSSVPQLSPFRYPGGKTWLVPTIRRWLSAVPAAVLVEPFGGGGIVSLTAVNERLVDRAVLVELDEGVAAVWQVALGRSDADAAELNRRIAEFDMTEENVREVLSSDAVGALASAFRTIVRNRAQRGGVLAPGAGLMKAGDGRGVASRWYPGTLAKRLTAIREMRERLSFVRADGLEVARAFDGAALFVDPPYTVSKSSAGRRLYTHHAVDHDAIFESARDASGPVLMTYDDTPEVRALAAEHGFSVGHALMQTGHNRRRTELVLTLRSSGAEL